MPSYFNATNGPLSFQLRDGSSAGVSTKKWIEIPAEQDSSASIVRLVRQGFLVRGADMSVKEAVSLPSSKPAVSNVPAVQVAPAAPAPAPKAAPAPSAPAAKAAPKTEPAKAETTKATSVPPAPVSAKENSTEGASTTSKDK